MKILFRHTIEWRKNYKQIIGKAGVDSLHLYLAIYQNPTRTAKSGILIYGWWKYSKIDINTLLRVSRTRIIYRV